MYLYYYLVVIGYCARQNLMVASIILQTLLRLRPYPMSRHWLLCKEMHIQSGSVLQHTYLDPIDVALEANKQHAQSSTNIPGMLRRTYNISPTQMLFHCPQMFLS